MLIIPFRNEEASREKDRDPEHEETAVSSESCPDDQQKLVVSPKLFDIPQKFKGNKMKKIGTLYLNKGKSVLLYESMKYERSHFEILVAS